MLLIVEALRDHPELAKFLTLALGFLRGPGDLRCGTAWLT